MLKGKILFYIVLVSILLTGCAKRGTITGGPKDTIAPVIVSSSPRNMVTNFTGNEIKISFSEYIKVKDISKQLIISPPLKYTPDIVPSGSASKFINIKIKDTLQPNTTYSFNFGQSITDNNEGNPYSQFRFVFSTGDYIDSLAIGGTIKDAYSRDTDHFVTVGLYEANETFNDSTIYKQKPRYVTNTLDSLKLFSLQNIKQGNYYIVALKDAGNNYVFNPKVDKIGFLKDPISIPNDTLFQLELFKEKGLLKSSKPTLATSNRLFIPYEGATPIEGDIKASVKNATTGDAITTLVTKIQDKDSLQLWLPRALKADSLFVKLTQKDTVRDFTVKLKELKDADSLSVESIQKGGLDFRDRFALKASTPLISIDSTKIRLINKDSIAIAFTHTYDAFNQKLYFDFKKEETEQYTFTLLPGALTDFYNKSNDTLSFKVSTKSYSDYGNLHVILKNVKRFPVIVELTDEKGKVYASAFTDKETGVNFDAIEPNKYVLRVIYDDNKNREWDTGDYMKRLQAEEVIYFEGTKDGLIDVRANWDVEQDFSIGQ